MGKTLSLWFLPELGVCVCVWGGGFLDVAE